MDSTDTKQIVKNAWKAFASHDPERIAAVFTDDAQWLAPPGNATAKALGHTEHVLEHRLQATLANGRHYDNDYCFVIETRDGRIHRMREYMDTQRGFRCIFADAELTQAA